MGEKCLVFPARWSDQDTRKHLRSQSCWSSSQGLERFWTIPIHRRIDVTESVKRGVRRCNLILRTRHLWSWTELPVRVHRRTAFLDIVIHRSSLWQEKTWLRHDYFDTKWGELSQRWPGREFYQIILLGIRGFCVKAILLTPSSTLLLPIAMINNRLTLERVHILGHSQGYETDSCQDAMWARDQTQYQWQRKVVKVDLQITIF